MRRRALIVGSLLAGAAGILYFGLRSAQSVADAHRGQGREQIDRELITATAQGAVELRRIVRASRHGTVPTFTMTVLQAAATRPLSEALVRAERIERDSGDALHAYLGIILETEDPSEEIAARRNVARLLIRRGARAEAIRTLEEALEIEGGSAAERELATQALAFYRGDAPPPRADGPEPAVRLARARLEAAADPDQLVRVDAERVAWKMPDGVGVARLTDVLASTVPGYARGKWRLSTSDAGRALPLPFPRARLVHAGHRLGVVEAEASRLRNWHALPALVAALLLGAGAVLAWLEMRRRERFEQRRHAFLSAVTHELKTPIANISLYAEILKEHGRSDPDRVPEFADVVLKETERLRKRVQEMLDVATGRRNLQDGAFDPVTVVREVVEDCDAPIELDIEEGCPRARGAAALFRRAVEGLLDNAFKFAPQGTVSLELASHDGKLRLAIEDEGPGIPAAERERVFEPFVRLGNALTASTPGTGLGLTLIRQCVQDCGGEVSIEEGARGGARVSVILETHGG